MQILGQKLKRNWLNVFFAVKRSILLWFVNFKLAFGDLSDKTNLMSRINVGLIGNAQWYLEFDGFYLGEILG